ncbi:MAG: MFS transporter, partial [Sulfolobales archaeon]
FLRSMSFMHLWCRQLARAETRNVVSTAVFNLFRGLATSGFNALFATYMSRLGYSLSEIGAVATLSNVLGASISPLVGYLLEVYSSRMITALTGFMISASLVIAAFSENIITLAFSYALFHLSMYFAQPARMAFLARVVDKKRLGTVVGLTSSTFTASRAVGPVIGGFLVMSFGYMYAFSTLAGIAVAGSLLFLACSHEPEPKKTEMPNRPSLADCYMRAIAPDRRLLLLYIFASLDRAAWNLWHPILGAYLLRQGYSEVSIGTLVSISNVAETVGTPLAGKLVDKLGSSTILAFSELTAAMAALTLMFPTATHLTTLSMLFIGISISFWIPGYNVYVAKVFKNVGETFASVNAIRSIVSIPSPYLGGSLYDSMSSLAPFFLSAVMLTVATVIASKNLKRVEALYER